MYKIGDDVFVVHTKTVVRKIPCPDCGGTLRLTVILFNGEIFTLECQTCQRSLYGPSGETQKRHEIPKFCHGVIESKTETVEGNFYRIGFWLGEYLGHNDFPESKISKNPFQLRDVFKEKLRKYKEQQKINFEYQAKAKKEKWSRSVALHRKKIRDLKRSLEWHEKVLSFAKKKAKNS